MILAIIESIIEFARQMLKMYAVLKRTHYIPWGISLRWFSLDFSAVDFIFQVAIFLSFVSCSVEQTYLCADNVCIFKYRYKEIPLLFLLPLFILRSRFKGTKLISGLNRWMGRQFSIIESPQDTWTLQLICIVKYSFSFCKYDVKVCLVLYNLMRGSRELDAGSRLVSYFSWTCQHFQASTQICVCTVFPLPPVCLWLGNRSEKSHIVYI